MLYAIQVGEAGPIKLGRAVDPRKRLKELQIAHPDPLCLRATWPGHQPHERELHERFADTRLSGEWFAPTPALEAFVTERALENHPLEGTPLRDLFGPSDEQAFELAARLPASRAARVDRAMTTLLERAARVPLNPVAEAHALVALLDELRLTQEQLGRRVGRSQEWISNSIRLLNLPDQALMLLERGDLTRAHGRALLAEPDTERQAALGCVAAQEGWTVRRLGREIAAPYTTSASASGRTSYGARHGASELRRSLDP